MTFKLYSIELTNFKGYSGTHEFEMPQEAGLYYLTGRNEYNPRLGANGAGKSSLFDGVEWCLYGKTHRGLRAGDVVSWGKKSCSVSTSWLIADEEYTIVRTQSPNALTLNGEPATQEEITKLIRLNQEAFNASVILPQFGESFFDLTPSRKLEMFSEVMNLDYWLQKSRQASKKVEIFEHEMEKLNNQISSRIGKLENNRAHIKSLTESEGRHEKEVKADIKERKEQIKELKKRRESQVFALKRHTKNAKLLANDVAEVRTAIKEVGAEFEKTENKYIGYVSDLKANDRRINELQREIKDTEKRKGQVCSSCKQRIDEKHVKSQVKALTKKCDELVYKNHELNKATDKLEKERGKLRKDVLDLSQLLRTLEGDYNSVQNDINACDRNIRGATADIKKCEDDIEKLKGKENPFTSLLSVANKYSRTLRKEIAELQRELDEIKIEHEAYTYWVGGFKRVRLFVIEEALSALEVEVNNLLISLGLVDWKITLDVERENKSGGITKGFSVFIHSPKHDQPVKFEAWSGGEVQRLRLAGDLGLANLIMEQAGFVNHIEIIDEPSQHMSREGIEDMIETIHQRAHDTGRQIWLVDHHTTSFTGFSGVLTAVMDVKGKAHLEYKE